MATYHFSNKPHATLKSGEKMNVQTHYEYICREGKYSHMRDRSQEELVAVGSGNLPDWTYNRNKGKLDAKTFWTEDEKNRGKNNRGYREIRFALMEELTNEQNIELVETFLQRSGIKDKHAYSYAIHDKKAAFDSSHRNIHVHIMFCEKEIEQDKPLQANQYFKKYSIKKDGTAIGGYKTSRYYSSRDTTVSMRQLWEDIANDKFKELGMAERISCKTLKEQKEEAEEKQDYLKAGILDRKPAPNIGSIYRNPNNMERIRLLTKDFETALQDETKETEIEKIIQEAEHNAQERSMILFAQDLALRNTAKQIESEKKKQNEIHRLETEKQRQIAEAEEANNKIQEAPWAIMPQDIIRFIDKKTNTINQEIHRLTHELDNIYNPAMTKEKAKDIAIDTLTAGKYKTLTRELEQNKNKEQEYDKKESVLLKDTTEGSAERYAEYLKEKNTLKEKTASLEEEIKKIEQFLAEKKQEEKINKIAERIWQNHIRLREEQLQKNKTIRTLQSELEELKKQKELMEKETIPVYVSYSPNKVTRNALWNGTIPLKQFPIYVKNNTQYITIKENKNEAEAIKIGDVPDNGYTPVYKLSFTEEYGKKKIKEITKTENKEPLFQTTQSLMEKLSQDKDPTSPYLEKMTKINTAIEAKYNELFTGHEDQKEKEKKKDLKRPEENKGL